MTKGLALSISEPSSFAPYKTLAKPIFMILCAIWAIRLPTANEKIRSSAKFSHFLNSASTPKYLESNNGSG